MLVQGVLCKKLLSVDLLLCLHFLITQMCSSAATQVHLVTKMKTSNYTLAQKNEVGEARPPLIIIIDDPGVRVLPFLKG